MNPSSAISQLKAVLIQGLWKNNSALVQLLGLCPLLAVTSTATNALGLGLATTMVLILTNTTVSALRRWIPAEIRIPIYVMIIASVVSAVQLLINAFAIGLYQSLGIFIPLIVTNCIVIGRAEAFAAKNSVPLAALDGLATGLGASAAMLVLGSLREILGNGTLFAGANSLLGQWASALRIELFHSDTPFLLALLPPGAFIGLGFLLAAKYVIDEKRQHRQAVKSQLKQISNRATNSVTGTAMTASAAPVSASNNALHAASLQPGKLIARFTAQQTLAAQPSALTSAVPISTNTSINKATVQPNLI